MIETPFFSSVLKESLVHFLNRSKPIKMSSREQNLTTYVHTCNAITHLALNPHKIEMFPILSLHSNPFLLTPPTGAVTNKLLHMQTPGLFAYLVRKYFLMDLLNTHFSCSDVSTLCTKFLHPWQGPFSQVSIFNTGCNQRHWNIPVLWYYWLWPFSRGSVNLPLNSIYSSPWRNDG
jgi:hypothetical protein